MTTESVSDEMARRQALDPARSFIVQAPAGAGKTELLTQRFLVLLAVVDRPEEILAITFTRKAAAEMRARVLDALVRAGGEPAPVAVHERRTWELAQRVRERDALLGWRLEENPGRLGIQTIDSFCLGLTRQMPLLARFGAPPTIVEDAEALYREAAYATLALLDGDNRHARSIERLLRHLDNDARRVAGMLIEMLRRRDQWLRRVGDRARLRREALESALTNVVADALAEFGRALPSEFAGEIAYNAAVAAENLAAEDSGSLILACRGLKAVPGFTIEQLPYWLGIANLFLTGDGKWRRVVTKKQGFLSKSDGKTAAEKHANEEAKTRVLALIDKISIHVDFGRRLHGLRSLPPLHYDDTQWEILQALIEILPVAAAQLKLVFAEHGGVDFTEVSQGALDALGDPEAPTDLLLALDYRLRHLLVDEFQDTSVSQYELLERLTAGWMAGDGRTLFLVGDPMQSIYRFREAEVGLYLRAAHGGIGSVPLTKLTLSANFRSQAGVVEWVNQSFGRIFPTEEDIGAGAVRYSPCEPVKPRLSADAVTVHPFFRNDPAAEADKVAALVEAAQAAAPDEKTVILVRSRQHLAVIVPRFKQAGFRFRAIEIERLAERQIVQDLLALTRALLHPADRTAWLSVLRAPWCGLTLGDLHVLAGETAPPNIAVDDTHEPGGLFPHPLPSPGGRGGVGVRPDGRTVHGRDRDAAVWDLLQDDVRVRRLSVDGQQRLVAVREVLQGTLANRGRTTVRRYIEGVWVALGGPACVLGETDLADAEAYFQLLEGLDGATADVGQVVGQAARLFAASDVEASDRLQIMTIHKAKGLEFDTVIVPSLGRRQRNESVRLLAWTERARGDSEPDLLLAPIHATGSGGDLISDYLRDLDWERGRNEDLRLLYVAATRAKKRLHLLGHVETKAVSETPTLAEPAAGSLLKALWPAVEPIYATALQSMTAPAVPADAAPPDWACVQDIRRLASGWELPPPPAGVSLYLDAPTVTPETAIEFEWVGEAARHIGTVVHRWLLRIGNDGVADWNVGRIGAQEPAFQSALAHLGVPPQELMSAVDKVRTALLNVLEDKRARWVLGAHAEARSEYALTGMVDGRVVNVVLDRTFVDNDGVRWVIDYKTSMHEGGNKEVFLDSEQHRYTAQLERYAALLAHTESRPVRLGLYFPLLRGWREWVFSGNRT